MAGTSNELERRFPVAEVPLPSTSCACDRGYTVPAFGLAADAPGRSHRAVVGARNRRDGDPGRASRPSSATTGRDGASVLPTRFSWLLLTGGPSERQQGRRPRLRNVETDAYVRMLDPKSSTGAVVCRCEEVYCQRLGPATSLMQPLRLLCSIVHSCSELPTPRARDRRRTCGQRAAGQPLSFSLAGGAPEVLTPPSHRGSHSR